MDETTAPTSTHQSCTAAKVLIIGADLEEFPAEIRDAVESCTCVYVADVYRALVRVAKDEPDVVIVAVDWLPTVALEFFELIARSHRELPVLVHGSPRAASKIEETLRRGATGIASAEAIRQIVAPPEAPQHSLTQQPETLPTPERKKTDTFAPTGNVFDAELDRRLRQQVDADAPVGSPADNGGRTTDFAEGIDAAEYVPGSHDAASIEGSTEADISPESPDDEPQDLGARVPWQRYMDRPQRVPPRRTSPADPRSAAVVTHHGLDPDPPLLSAEEIAALMGDLPSNRSH